MNKLSEQEIQKSLQENSQNPDLLWVKKTRENLSVFAHNSVTNQNEGRISVYTLFNFLSFSSMQSAYKKPMLLGLTAALLLVGGLSGAYLYINNRNNTTVQSTKVFLSETEKKDFLTNVIKNNSKQTLAKANIESQSEALTANNTATFSTKFAGGSADKMMASSQVATGDMSILPYPYKPDFKYRYSKTDVTFGDAHKNCKSMAWNADYSSNGTISENYEYFDNSNNSYSKYVIKTKNNKVINLTLSINSVNKSEYYNYAGGEYAVKTTNIYAPVDPNTAPISTDVTIMPITEPYPDNVVEDSTDIISQYFGPDAQVVEKVTLDGKELYVIEYSYNTDCDQDNTSTYKDYRLMTPHQNLNDKIILRDLIDIETFQAYENYVYLNSVADANLLSKTKNTIVSSNVDFSSVSNEFKFDINVPVKEELFDWSKDSYTYDYKKEANAIADYLERNPIELLYINNATLSSIYSAKASEEIGKAQPQGLNYYQDRAFYLAGVIGDEMYMSATTVTPYYENNYIAEVASIGFFTGDNSYTGISVYNKADINAEALKKQLSGYSEGDENVTAMTKDISVSINGTTVNAKIYEVIYTYPAVDQPTIDPATSTKSDITIGEPMASNYTTRNLVIEFGNYMYTISLDDVQYNALVNNTLSFVTKNSKTNAAEIRQELLTAYEIMYNTPPQIMPIEGGDFIGGEVKAL